MVLGIFCKDKDLVFETFVGASFVDEPVLAERFVAGHFCSFFYSWAFYGRFFLWSCHFVAGHFVVRHFVAGHKMMRRFGYYTCFAPSPRRPYIEDKRMVLEHTHGLFIT